MEQNQVVLALEALAQEHRLSIFRDLVKAGPTGMTPTQLGERLSLPGPTLSFHLTQLRHAGLVTVTRNGRSLSYAAAYTTMQALLAYLTENCCAGTACPRPSPAKPATTSGKTSTTRNVKRRT